MTDTDTYLIVDIADEVRSAAELLHAAARQAELCDPADQRHVQITTAQAHAIASAFEHIADDMGDLGAVERTEGIVNGPYVVTEGGNSRFDWSDILGAARALLADELAAGSPVTAALLNTVITDIDTIESLPIGAILLEQRRQHPGQAMAWRKERDGWWYPSTFSWVRQRGALAMAGAEPTLIWLPAEAEVAP